jgi:hypothetical protein
MLTKETKRKILSSMGDMHLIEERIEMGSIMNAKPLIKNYLTKNRQILALICSALEVSKDDE